MTFDQEMKKSTPAILLIVLLLVGVAVLVRIRPWEASGSQGTSGSQDASNRNVPRPVEQTHTHDDTLVDGGRTKGLPAGQRIEADALLHAGGSWADLRDPRDDRTGFTGVEGFASIYFVRSSTILRSEEPDLNALTDASARVLANYPPGTLVFDLDALSTIDEPVILYANPNLDLTSSIEAEYLRIASTPHGEEQTPIVEQADAGQSRP